MTDIADKPTIPEISAEADILYHRLSQLAPGEFVSYGELSKLIRRDVQRRGRGLMQTARRKVQRVDGIVTLAVVGEGLKRATGQDYAGIAVQGRIRGRRLLKRALRSSLLLPDDEYGELTDEQRTTLNTDRSLISAMVYFSDEKARRKVAPRAQVQGGRLAIGETLELMGDKPD